MFGGPFMALFIIVFSGFVKQNSKCFCTVSNDSVTSREADNATPHIARETAVTMQELQLEINIRSR